MALFVYQAKDRQGNEHQGSIEASDPVAVARLLTKKGLVVISIKEKQEDSSIFNRFFNNVSFSDIVIMTRQLATMIEAGLVLSEALDILESQQTNPKLKRVLGDISRDLKGGLDLAGAIKRHPDIFPPLYSNLIRAGESSGKLDTVLIQMATNLERDREFRARIKGAMIYPAMIIIMMVVVVSIMMFFVIPRLTSLYTQSNIELPLPTKILIGTSNFFVTFWWLIIILVGVGAFMFRKWVQTPQGKEKFDFYLLKVPIVNKIITGATLTTFTRTFGLLVAAGVPILESLQIVSDVLTNNVYRNALKKSASGVERGLTLSSQLEQIPIFPKMVSQMMRVGEETGKLDEISFKMAEYYESESDHMVKNLTVVIEPLILVLLGIGVAFLVLSIILPIYKLTTSIS